MNCNTTHYRANSSSVPGDPTYIGGKDLRAIFDRCRKTNQPAPIALSCYVISKACEGLDYAHRKQVNGRPLNVVHRDVSPQNILISFEGDVKIIDFGIAKAAGKATKTQAGILKGKFGYMSPEQVAGLPIDHRSDIFAIGVCLYEMLTGDRLFVADSDFSVLERVRKLDVVLPSTLNRNIPDALEKIVMKALAKEAADRYTHASEIADELQRFLISQGIMFGRKDLAEYMKSAFADEVERERQKVLEYADVQQPERHESIENHDDQITVDNRSGFGARPRESGPKGPPPPPKGAELESERTVGVAPYIGDEPAPATELGPRPIDDIPTSPPVDRPPEKASEPPPPPPAVAPVLDPRRKPSPAMLSPHPVPSHLTLTDPMRELGGGAAPRPSLNGGSPRPSKGGSQRARQQQSSNRLLLALMFLTTLLLGVAVGALILLRPKPTGLLLLDVPAGAEVLDVNVNGHQVVEKDGSPIKTWPHLYQVPAGETGVLINVKGYKPLIETVTVPEGGTVTNLTKSFQKE